jgi:hypothetical protein
MTQQHLLFHSRDRDHIRRELQLLAPSTSSIVVQYQEDEMAMAQDAEGADGFPPVVSPNASASCSPRNNVQLKQEQPLCTTQASLAAIIDVNARADVAFSPATIAPQAQAYETRRSAAVTATSRDQVGGADGTERRGSSPTPRNLGREPHPQYDDDVDYVPEGLSQRLQNFQPSHSTGFDGYYSPDTISNKTAAESVSTPRQDLTYNANNRGERLSLHDLDVQPQPGDEWMPVDSCTPPQQAPYQQPLHLASRFALVSAADRPQPTSAPYTAAGGQPGQSSSYQDVPDDGLGFVPTHGLFEPHVHADGIPITNLSPCSSTLAMGSDAICARREDTAPLSDPDINMDADMVYQPNLCDAEDVLGSGSSTEPGGGKNEEPYAQLIYRAFMSRPNKSMTLQEIYQWFRENTDKAKSAGKGWQNSIRHNLSMNGVGDSILVKPSPVLLMWRRKVLRLTRDDFWQAFTKRSLNQPALNSDGSLSLDASGADARKSTEWFLESRYYGGVESTTRYRKGNSKAGGRHTRAERAVEGNVKAVSGRKGGFQAAHNRKRTKAEQQQEAARQRNHRLHLQQYGRDFCADEDGRFYPQPLTEYHAHFQANTSAPFQIQTPPSLNRHAGVPRGRQSPLDINYFQPRLPDSSAHDTHGKALPAAAAGGGGGGGGGGDVNAAAEPVTPPGSGHDSQQMGHAPYDNDYHHPYLPGFFIPHDTTGYHQPHHPGAPVVVGAAGTPSPPGYPPPPAYTFNQVEGVFEGPPGIEPPLFISGKNLTSEEAAALVTANPWTNDPRPF